MFIYILYSKIISVLFITDITGIYTAAVLQNNACMCISHSHKQSSHHSCVCGTVNNQHFIALIKYISIPALAEWLSSVLS